MSFLRFTEKVNRFLALGGIGMVIIMMTIITLNILGRVLFRTPVYGTVEVVQLAGVVMVSLIIAYTQFRKQNIAVTIVTDRLSPRRREIINTFSYLVSAAFVALVMWASGSFTMSITSETTYIFEITTVPFRLIFVFGCAVLLLVICGQFVESLSKVLKR